MPNLKKMLLTIVVFYAILAAVCVYIGIQDTVSLMVLLPFEFSCFWSAWLIAFVNAAPTVTFVAIIFGYTQMFAAVTGAAKNQVNYNQFFGTVIKQICVIALIFCGISFICREVLYPKADFCRMSSSVHSQEYRGYAAALESARISGNDDETLAILNRMLVISDYDADLVDLHDMLLARIQVKTATKHTPEPSTPVAPLMGESLSFYDALQKAEETVQQESWFNAHYYASLAIKLSGDRDPDKSRALKIAADSWNVISKQQTDIQLRTDYDLYSQKLRGYGALQQGEFLKAYYTFLDLRRRQSDDPDIEKYLDISLYNVNNTRFFTNELDKLVFRGKSESFNSGFCDFFLIKSHDGGINVIFFNKIARNSDSKNYVLYVQGLEIMEFTPYGSLRYHVSAPYAKFFPCCSSIDSSETWQTIVVMNAEDSLQPNKGYYAEILSGELPFKDSGIVTLDITMKDLMILLEKDYPLTKVPLGILLNMYSTIERFGFSRNEVLSELVYRISLPLFWMLFIFLAVWCSWKFRIKNGASFKKRYFCFAPIFFVIIYIIISFFEYLYRCLVFTVSATAGIYTAPIVFVLLLLLLAGVILSLSCQRNT